LYKHQILSNPFENAKGDIYTRDKNFPLIQSNFSSSSSNLLNTSFSAHSSITTKDLDMYKRAALLVCDVLTVVRKFPSDTKEKFVGVENSCVMYLKNFPDFLKTKNSVETNTIKKSNMIGKISNEEAINKIFCGREKELILSDEKKFEEAKNLIIYVLKDDPSSYTYIFKHLEEHAHPSKISKTSTNMRKEKREIGIINAYMSTSYILSVVQQLYRCKMLRYTVLRFNPRDQAEGLPDPPNIKDNSIYPMFFFSAFCFY
jgi:hypothetical protein